MKEIVKSIIKLHIFIYVCLSASIFGIYLFNNNYGYIAFYTITTILPLSLLLSTAIAGLKK